MQDEAFRTKVFLCAPLRTIAGEEIGVSQILNKIDGEFEQEDLDLLEAMTEQAAAIQGNILLNKSKLQKARIRIS